MFFISFRPNPFYIVISGRLRQQRRNLAQSFRPLGDGFFYYIIPRTFVHGQITRKFRLRSFIAQTDEAHNP